ncbi:damage-control phosphatase ARMT1-like [Condylostylus longicornis]|uniref:damage-control phosphatase ARMT1-like n=1 Tax=Condylostylus longicornis TaxID=2530218 RepID=UPI00244E09FB|nr:damage-control phosphatase ARMT1-like [Condylostylus longicornis]
MVEFERNANIIDDKCPRHSIMIGRYKQSFAYYTLRERLPVILTKVIDDLSQNKDTIINECSEEAREELKIVVGNISELKYQLQTDKELYPLETNEIDKSTWNIFLSSLPENERTYFSTCWLWAECYLYRRLKTIFEATTTLKNFDYFKSSKQKALIGSKDSIVSLVKSTRQTLTLDSDIDKYFKKLLYLDLWGNKCDLSITEGKDIKQTGDQLEAVDHLKEYILIDQAEEIWNLISQKYTGERYIDFICDNAGYELFTDFLLAEYIIEHKLATKIRFYIKAIPWFISDTTPEDFEWVLKYLYENNNEELKLIGNKWKSLVDQGKFILLEPDRFFISPYEYYRMKEIAPHLYDKLSEAHLLIIKGDLNYRKLLGDFTWDYTEKFETCLRGFNPTNICSLRTVKADLICGLEEGLAEKLFEKDSNWMLTGEYGTVMLQLHKN